MLDDNRSTGGVAPFGYKWQHGKLVIDENESPVRKLIYELFITYRRKKTVAKILNDLGYRTRRGALFSDTTIGRLLRDKTAKGIHEIDDHIVNIDPVIDFEIWEEANRILGQPAPTKQTPKLFSGIVFCFCGGKMAVPSNSPKYICPDCRRKIPSEDLEDVFRDQLRRLEDEELNAIVDVWIALSSKDQRLLIEQICSRVVVEHDTIKIDLVYPTKSSKTLADGQQIEVGNVTPDIPGTQERITDLQEPLLSEAAAARFLGISRMTLLRKRNAGEIGFFRVGSRVLYSMERQLLPFLKSREQR